jgi:RNA polymerase sigma-70 factor (ECF subfamily)
VDARTLNPSATIVPFPSSETAATVDAAEQHLIVQAQQRDHRAFQELYNRYLRRTYTLCLRLTGQVTQAEDITQEVFILLWRKLDSFNGNSAFSTWLHTLTTNTAISYMRRQKSWWQRLQATDDYEALAEQVVAEPAPALAELEAALARLPERARVVFVLHALEGYRQESIAKVLGITTGTVKAQFHRAKQLLEQWLLPEHGGADE